MMLKELAELGVEIGMALEAAPNELSLRESWGKLAEALAKQTRPDAERAALMLLSAGQELYGESEDGGSSEWPRHCDEACKLLGIVPLVNAE